jgi:hypothetical protein
MLGCIKPISSPMMNRMFGFFSSAAAGTGVAIFSCATAGAGVAIGAKPRAMTSAKKVSAPGLVLMDCLVLMGASCYGKPPLAKPSLRQCDVTIKPAKQTAV